MYQFLAVFLFAHCTEFSLENSIKGFNLMVKNVLSIRDITSISSNILVYLAIGRGNKRTNTWNELGDETHQLRDFDIICFRVVKKVFLDHLTYLALWMTTSSGRGQ